MPGGEKFEDYDDASVDAARSAIIELVTVLGEYREEIVLIGGWVPFLSLDEPDDPLDRHPGSADVDIVLDHRELEEAGYETIAKRLEEAGSWAPTQVGAFDSALNDEEQEGRQRDAFERIGYFLTELGFKTE